MTAGGAKNPRSGPDRQATPATAPPAPANPVGDSLLGRALLYPAVYIWYVVLAAADIVCTWVVLHRGGRELNALADWIISRYDLVGVLVFKFALVVLVVLICEAVGRRNRQKGLWLAHWAVAVSAIPVVVGLVHVLRALREPGL
jgi:hypothetical protein